jgi:hypothetical protein
VALNTSGHLTIERMRPVRHHDQLRSRHLLVGAAEKSRCSERNRARRRGRPLYIGCADFVDAEAAHGPANPDPPSPIVWCSSFMGRWSPPMPGCRPIANSTVRSG